MLAHSFLALLALSISSPVNALTSSLQQITANFGSNPTGVKMYIYKPTSLHIPTPLIIAMHYCTGTAQAYFSGTSLASLADQHGFIVIYPNAPTSGGCWDVATTATLTHNGGGDSLGIANVVRYAISNYGVDASRVFATGTSSGAMMTSVLLGAYPDLFAAGSLFSGVPYGCFKGPSAWNNQCANGQLIQTAQAWGDLVRSGYPGYTGTRPPVQFWHGTADTTLYPQNFWEEIKQWTNVFGVSATPTANVTNSPLNGYSRASFGPNIQGILAQGVGHTVPEQENDVLAWFGLSSLAPGGSTSTTSAAGTTTTTTTTTSVVGTATTTSVGITTTPPTTSDGPSTTTTSSAPATTSSPPGTVAHYGQCGGIGWTGGTVCIAPYVCKVGNPYYSQCL